MDLDDPFLNDFDPHSFPIYRGIGGGGGNKEKGELKDDEEASEGGAAAASDIVVVDNSDSSEGSIVRVDIMRGNVGGQSSATASDGGASSDIYGAADGLMGGDDSSTGLNSDAFREAGRVIFESQMTSSSVASQQERTTAALRRLFDAMTRRMEQMEQALRASNYTL